MITHSSTGTDADNLTDGLRVALEVHADMEGDYSDDGIETRAQVSAALIPLLATFTAEQIIDALADAFSGSLDARVFVVEGNPDATERLETKAHALVDALSQAKVHAR